MGDVTLAPLAGDDTQTDPAELDPGVGGGTGGAVGNDCGPASARVTVGHVTLPEPDPDPVPLPEPLPVPLPEPLEAIELLELPHPTTRKDQSRTAGSIAAARASRRNRIEALLKAF